ncbi:hypothetical protein GCM10010123_19490 [Pilimelia anulata]|uniref:MinD-like ATPase involved in chromosome partitioning or flagellar assembly n=1 Tax=Pilimelia anulata TaxID=53371 RepID=A0A8J3B262_9ACTN|nr:ParA family protein [Pilimelia anulata]GGJ89779.1 hypothetical protein GCM10010123_19490 [Pilimelia anulata]
MGVVAVCSAKGSPGVSTAALALTLSWPIPVVLAECDPAGGDALPGYLAGQVPADRGTAELAVAHARGRLREEFFGNLIDLEPPAQRRLLLPGISSPTSAGVVAEMGQDLAALFTDLDAQGLDVVADCGRLSAEHTLWPVIRAAGAVLLVVRATLPSLAHAQHALAKLEAVAAHPQNVRLLIVDDGPYASEAGRRLDAPVAGVWPWAPRVARKLSHGGALPRGQRLIVEAHRLARTLHDGVHRQGVSADVR